MNTKETIKEIQKDIKNLKLKAFKPNKNEARAFKEYLSWQAGNPKENFEEIYSKELELLNDWFDIYCKKNDCSKAEALEKVIQE